jgi:hypothetical protein
MNKKIVLCIFMLCWLIVFSTAVISAATELEALPVSDNIFIVDGLPEAGVLLLFGPVPSAVSPLPRGFTPIRTPERFGPPGQKLENGSIFDYMDGGGIVYLDHGFRELVHCEFSNSNTRLITFDRFIMETEKQALTALADEHIAPAGGTPLSLGVPNKAYRFPPDYFIYMVLDKSLIYLHVDDDILAETLDRFAADILKSPDEKKE